MARNRQRAKQRQAARRAARLAEKGQGGNAAARERAAAEPAGAEQAPPELEAPPEELGRSDAVLEAVQDEPGDGLAPGGDEDATLEGADTPSREKGRERRRDRGKVIGFLVNVWAELQRVQWPNRQQVTTLTGVVLGFVLLAGGYLGLLDAIFSRVIQAIL